jgi:plastocyanin
MKRTPCFVIFAMVSVSCGGSSSTTPSTTPAPTNTITITASGVSPKDIVVSAGSQVTFVNNDNRNHEMASDPHPEHTDCPEIDVFVVPGQSRQTNNLVNRRVCGYHDHLAADIKSLQGTITIQ